MEFISERSFTKQHKQFLQANDNYGHGIELHTKNIRSSTEHQDYQTNTQDHDGWGGGGGGYRKSPVFADYHVFALASYIERCMEDAIFMFLKKMIQLWPLQICLETLSVYIHLKMVTEEVVICIMAHVLIQMRCCLFPVILSSFHRLGRRNYIRAVKRYNENLSMLYTMIVK